MNRRRRLLLAGLLISVPAIADASTLKILYSFHGGSDGAGPTSSLLRGPDGNYYGTTIGGGEGCGCGTVFRLSSKGEETVLHTFGGTNDGQYPSSSLAVDRVANIYGTTAGGGDTDSGILFRIAPDGTESVLHFFGGSDGASPNAGPTLDRNGNLFGTTAIGGPNGGGTIYKFATDGSFTRLHGFGSGNDGAVPSTALTKAPHGVFYGTTAFGGVHGNGVVFALRRSGKESVLYNFSGGSDGADPQGVIRDSQGNLFGVTYHGGSPNLGTIFKLTPDGTESILHTFAGGSDGAGPSAKLAFDEEGNLYGTTSAGGGGGCSGGCGTIFKIAPDGTETILHAFSGGTDGSNPVGGLILDRHGDLIGTANQGGAFGRGTVFKLKN
jgi:uncharacterized repeat protein (TIGR03803 family)